MLALVVGAALVAAAVVAPGGSAQAASSNLVPNASVERSAGSRPTGWSPVATGSSVRSLRHLTNGAASGRRFVRTSVTSWTSGSAGWATTSIPVRPSTRYTYTVWSRSNAVALVRARVVDGRGHVTDVTLGRLAASAAWHATTFTITTTAGATRLSLRHLLASVGTLDVDAVRLVRAGVVSATPPTQPTQPTQPTEPTEPRASGAMVSVTFDDGLLSQYDNALPVLRANGIPATFYVVSGLIGISTTMTSAQVRTVQAAGNEIGSHTVTHRDLTTLSGPELTAELANSKAALEAQFGTVRALAYPYGATNATVAAAAARYYSSARTTDGGYNGPGGIDAYRLQTRYVTTGTTASDVAGWLRQAAGSGSWVVLVYHGVQNGGDAYSVTPSAFAAQMAAVKASGVRALTVSAALAAA